MALSRADNSILGRWWWTVDRWTLAALMVLIGFGDGSYQRIVIGIALVLAVWLDIVYRKRIK